MKKPNQKSPAKPKFKPKKWALALIFLCGLMIAGYPLVSQYYYTIEANRAIQDFDQAVAQLEAEDIAERFKLAEAYNSSLKSDDLQLLDPFSDEEKKAGVSEYANMLKVNERVGYVEIPKIKQQLPIYVGTVDSILEKGAGLLEGTSLPVGGLNTHTVITAHRGLPTAKLFTNLDKMKKGDVFYIHVLDRVLAYEVDQILVVEPSDFDPVLIQEGQDYATLLTCTPYMINSHRLLVRGKRVAYVPPIEEKILAVREQTRLYFWLLVLAVVVLVGLIVLALRYRLHIRQLLQKMEK